MLATSALADLDVLDRAVAQCERSTVNPLFASEAGRRSAFMTDVLKEQEEISVARLDIADRRRALREATPNAIGGDTEVKLNLLGLANEDRQRALNDRRSLESLRLETMDAKRHYFLAHCAGSKDSK